MANKKVNKVGKEFDKVVDEMKKLAPKFAKADGAEKDKILKKLKELTAKKKDLKAEIERSVMDAEKDVDLQIEVKQMIRTALQELAGVNKIGDVAKTLKREFIGREYIQPEDLAKHIIDSLIKDKSLTKFIESLSMYSEDYTEEPARPKHRQMLEDVLINILRKGSVNEIRSNIVQKWNNSDVVMSDMEDYLEMLYKDGNYDTMDDMMNTFAVLSKLAKDYMKAMM